MSTPQPRTWRRRRHVCCCRVCVLCLLIVSLPAPQHSGTLCMLSKHVMLSQSLWSEAVCICPVVSAHCSPLSIALSGFITAMFISHFLVFLHKTTTFIFFFTFSLKFYFFFLCCSHSPLLTRPSSLASSHSSSQFSTQPLTIQLWPSSRPRWRQPCASSEGRQNK